jgi:hypothetical protein
MVALEVAKYPDGSLSIRKVVKTGQLSVCILDYTLEPLHLCIGPGMQGSLVL